MIKHVTERITWPSLLFLSLFLVFLFIISLFNYHFFHSISELYCIIISAGVFIIVWNVRELQDNAFLLSLGMGYVAIAFLDLFHTVEYPFMIDGAFSDTDTPTQIWVSARFLESIVLFISPFFVKRKIPLWGFVLFLVSYITLVLLSIYQWNLFPACHIEGYGQTLFKRGIEVVIILILSMTFYHFTRLKDVFSEQFLSFFSLILIFIILSEFAFLFYISVYGISNFLGHIFKVISFYFIYKAIIETALLNPIQLLHKNVLEKTHEVQHIESRYYSLFNDCPVPHWEENLNEVIKEVNELKKSGVEDIKPYLNEHPDLVKSLMMKIRILNVNKAALELFQVESVEKFQSQLPEFRQIVTPQFFVQKIQNLSDGVYPFTIDNISKSMDDIHRYYQIRCTLLEPEHDPYGRVLLSIIDLTARQQLERELFNQKEQQFKEFLSMEEFADAGTLSVTAKSFGIEPLKKAQPTFYNEMIAKYGKIIDNVLEERAYKDIDHKTSEQIKQLANLLGFMQAGPGDITKIHTEVVKKKMEQASKEKARAILTESRFVFYEFLGNLTQYYRNYYTNSVQYLSDSNEDLHKD